MYAAKHLQESKKAYEDSHALLSTRLGDIDRGLSLSTASISTAESAAAAAQKAESEVLGLISAHQSSTEKLQTSVNASRKRPVQLKSLREEVAAVQADVAQRQVTVELPEDSLTSSQVRLAEDRALLATRQSSVHKSRATIAELEACMRMDANVTEHDIAAADIDAAALSQEQAALAAAVNAEAQRKTQAAARIALLKDQIASARSSGAAGVSTGAAS